MDSLKAQPIQKRSSERNLIKLKWQLDSSRKEQARGSNTRILSPNPNGKINLKPLFSPLIFQVGKREQNYTYWD